MNKTFEEIKTILETHREELSRTYHLGEIGIFGSYIRGEQKETSDLDILVEFKSPIGLLRFVKLKNYLSDILGVNVDLVMKKALRPKIGQRILNEVIYV
jgi:predicted nucleotidyltransferase